MLEMELILYPFVHILHQILVDDPLQIRLFSFQITVGYDFGRERCVAAKALGNQELDHMYASMLIGIQIAQSNSFIA